MKHEHLLKHVEDVSYLFGENYAFINEDYKEEINDSLFALMYHFRRYMLVGSVESVIEEFKNFYDTKTHEVSPFIALIDKIRYQLNAHESYHYDDGSLYGCDCGCGGGEFLPTEEELIEYEKEWNDFNLYLKDNYGIIDLLDIEQFNLFGEDN